jgi:hypothetical protein
MSYSKTWRSQFRKLPGDKEPNIDDIKEFQGYLMSHTPDEGSLKKGKLVSDAEFEQDFSDRILLGERVTTEKAQLEFDNFLREKRQSHEQQLTKKEQRKTKKRRLLSTLRNIVLLGAGAGITGGVGYTTYNALEDPFLNAQTAIIEQERETLEFEIKQFETERILIKSLRNDHIQNRHLDLEEDRERLETQYAQAIEARDKERSLLEKSNESILNEYEERYTELVALQTIEHDEKMQALKERKSEIEGIEKKVRAESDEKLLSPLPLLTKFHETGFTPFEQELLLREFQFPGYYSEVIYNNNFNEEIRVEASHSMRGNNDISRTDESVLFISKYDAKTNNIIGQWTYGPLENNNFDDSYFLQNISNLKPESTTLLQSGRVIKVDHIEEKVNIKSYNQLNEVQQQNTGFYNLHSIRVLEEFTKLQERTLGIPRIAGGKDE